MQVMNSHTHIGQYTGFRFINDQLPRVPFKGPTYPTERQVDAVGAALQHVPLIWLKGHALHARRYLATSVVHLP